MGSEPRFPAGSKKRGMARAIEIVEWMRDYADARLAECNDPQSILASVYRQQVSDYAAVVKALKDEAR